MKLKGKKILLGITGGIAAYKMCDFARSLIKLGADVKVILTPHAKEFVTVTTLQTLTKNPVYTEQFQIDDWRPEHINLADDSDIFIIAPASANTVGKMANGICDNLLTSIFMAFKKPVLIAPAMNCNMWDNNIIQENISNLKDNGCLIIEPVNGFLACGYEGKGRLADPEIIKEKTIEILSSNQFLKGKKFFVTAGGTKEYIDPIRFIGNESSGKMGIAIADSLYELGAEVTLISTVQAQKSYKIINVKTADEMLFEIKEGFKDADCLVMAAAVADYKAKKTSSSKLKKTDEDTFSIDLIKNPDILKEISLIKQENQTLIGFAAETENLINNAKKKIKSKNLDYIIANDVSNKEIGFNSDYNKVSLIDKDGNIKNFEKATKKEIAKKIIKEIFNG